MKTVRIALVTGLLILPALGLAEDDSFCAGYQQGYDYGACEGEYPCMSPMPPMCPMQRNAAEDDYEGGYVRGLRDAKEQEEQEENSE